MAEEPAPAEKTETRKESGLTPRGLVIGGAVLIIIGTALQFLAQTGLIRNTVSGNMRWLVEYLLELPAIVVTLIGAIITGIGTIRWALHSPNGPTSAGQDGSTTQSDQAIALLQSISDRLLISDSAKRIAYRAQDRETLRRAIREDIDKGDFDAALALVDDMSQSYGYREEAETYRDEIISARAADRELKTTEGIALIDQLVEQYDWDRAFAEASKIKRLYPESHRTHDVEDRVRQAREQYKHTLERRFLEAAQKHNVDEAMDMLKELDAYLTPSEAEPLRETARGVIGEKRDNLGVQLKMSAHEGDWPQAYRTAQQLIRDFPNSKMAEEARGMLDMLRKRAAEQQEANRAL